MSKTKSTRTQGQFGAWRSVTGKSLGLVDRALSKKRKDPLRGMSPSPRVYRRETGAAKEEETQ